MPNIKRHKGFLKDFASTKITDSQFEKFVSYVTLLRDAKPLPKEARDHILKGNWSDFRECHLGGDVLLVYYVQDNDIVLARLGTHSEIFG